MAGLKKEGLDGLNWFAGGFLATRVLYTGVYMTQETRNQALIRSALWDVGIFMCLGTIIRAARTLGSGRL